MRWTIFIYHENWLRGLCFTLQKARINNMSTYLRKEFRNDKSQNYVNAAAKELGNKPPQATDIEEAVIGAMLIDADCVSDAMEVLQSKSFYDL